MKFVVVTLVGVCGVLAHILEGPRARAIAAKARQPAVFIAWGTGGQELPDGAFRPQADYVAPFTSYAVPVRHEISASGARGVPTHSEPATFQALSFNAAWLVGLMLMLLAALLAQRRWQHVYVLLRGRRPGEGAAAQPVADLLIALGSSLQLIHRCLTDILEHEGALSQASHRELSLAARRSARLLRMIEQGKSRTKQPGVADGNGASLSLALLDVRPGGLRPGGDGQATPQAPQAPLPLHSLTPSPDPFLETVNAAVVAHFTDAAFDAMRLAEAVAMSERHLRRRLKALTGETPAVLIRRIRLQRAAALLAARGASVKEVAHAVGFSSRSHFSRVFAQHFGVPPSAYGR